MGFGFYQRLKVLGKGQIGWGKFPVLDGFHIPARMMAKK
jgi:hypothetical protein